MQNVGTEEDFSSAAPLPRTAVDRVYEVYQGGKLAPLGLEMPVKKTRAKRVRWFLVERRGNWGKTWRIIGKYTTIKAARSYEVGFLEHMLFVIRVRRTDLPT